MKKRDLQQFIGYSKGVLTVEKILTKRPNNKDVDVLCRCSRCGQTSVVRLGMITNKHEYAKNCCNICREDYHLQEKKNLLIGKKNGVLTCINIVLDRDVERHSKYAAVCQCSNCGSISTVRPERLTDTTYGRVSVTTEANAYTWVNYNTEDASYSGVKE